MGREGERNIIYYVTIYNIVITLKRIILITVLMILGTNEVDET